MRELKHIFATLAIFLALSIPVVFAEKTMGNGINDSVDDIPVIGEENTEDQTNTTVTTNISDTTTTVQQTQEQNETGEKEDNETVCAQVITYAVNSAGICKVFSTPCDVPKGWKVVDSCPTTNQIIPPVTPPEETSIVNTRLTTCIEKLENLQLPSEAEAKTVCEFIVGIKKQVLNDYHKLMKCIAEGHLINPNATYKQLRRRCFENILQPVEHECPTVPAPVCPANTVLEPVLDSKGCVIKYRCKEYEEGTFQGKLIKCISEKTATGMSRVEAKKKCYKELKEEAKKLRKTIRERIKTMSKPSDKALITHLQCMDLPDDVKEEAMELVKELKELIVEHKEKIREKSEECSGKIESVENETEIGKVKKECALQLSEINKEFAEKMKETREKALEIYETYKSTLNTTCIRELMNTQNIVEEYESEKQKILNNTNLSLEEKQKLLREIVINKTRELKKHGKGVREAVIEGIRSFMEKEEVKDAIISALKQDKTLIREVLTDPEIRQEIINQIVSNPRDVELIKEAIRNREAKIKLIKESKKRTELKRQLIRNKDIIKEILPLKLRERIDRINVTDLDTETVGNQTAIKAQIRERARLFFIIPVTVPKTVKFIEDQIIEERRPWWAFLVTG
jgi:hypothetical protein